MDEDASSYAVSRSPSCQRNDLLTVGFSNVVVCKINLARLQWTAKKTQLSNLEDKAFPLPHVRCQWRLIQQPKNLISKSILPFRRGMFPLHFLKTTTRGCAPSQAMLAHSKSREKRECHN